MQRAHCPSMDITCRGSDKSRMSLSLRGTHMLSPTDSSHYGTLETTPLRDAGELIRSEVPIAGKYGDLVLELLAELQRDGEEDQGVVQPRHHALHFMYMADLEALAVQLEHGSRIMQDRTARGAEILGGVGLQGVQLVDQEAQLIHIHIEVQQNVRGQRRGEHFRQAAGGHLR